jgi:hypothetical protein
MEVARMFGGWPHELLALPTSEYRRLQHYYFAVKRKEAEARGDEPDETPDEE